MSDTSEASRLESLWEGDFGDAYVARNLDAGEGREAFWADLLRDFPARTAIEIGCNIGGNLRWIGDRIGRQNAYGIDVNHAALAHLRAHLPGINVCRARAREIPLRDGSVELAFTVGVLIHQPLVSLHAVMSEIYRCTARYILCAEYFAPADIEVPYRGEEGALFKRDFGRMYQDLFPSLRLRKRGLLSRDSGWDDVTYWVLDKHE